LLWHRGWEVYPHGMDDGTHTQEGNRAHEENATHEPIHFRARLLRICARHSISRCDGTRWGAEAFERAKSEDKPILLDIGACGCHWCHVMDRESYENPAIASIINQQYVAMKVDRDERPDVTLATRRRFRRSAGRAAGR